VCFIYPQVECSSPFYVIYFTPAWLESGKSVLTRYLIIKFTCVVCKHDEKCRSCEYGYVIHVLILLLFIFNRNWWMSGYSSESQKTKKSKRISKYDWYEFSVSRMHKLVHVRNRCRNVWIMSLSYILYIIVSGSFLFSGFNRIPHFTRPTTVNRCWLNKVLRVSLQGSVATGWSQATGRKGGWPWQPSMSFDGRIAEE
jgi:hypothetical protein